MDLIVLNAPDVKHFSSLNKFKIGHWRRRRSNQQNFNWSKKKFNKFFASPAGLALIRPVLHQAMVSGLGRHQSMAFGLGSHH